MTDRPIRIQRKRTKGWKMPAGAVYVGRPTVFGNPIDHRKCSRKEAVRLYRRMIRQPQTHFIDQFPIISGLAMIVWREKVKKMLPELRGKNLACWCPLDQPCHADVLLELANGSAVMK